MNFDLIPDDDKKSRKPSTQGTRIGPAESKSKSENPWKGRFDRRKSARQVDVDYPMSDAANDEKPNSES